MDAGKLFVGQPEYVAQSVHWANLLPTQMLHGIAAPEGGPNR